MRDARRETMIREALPAELEEDVRRVVPDWAEVADLVEGARQRGWTEAQVAYLTSVVGVTWAKAFRAGQKKGPIT